MEHGIARAEEILTAAGAKRLFCSRTALDAAGHLLQHRARVGSNPSAQVVKGSRDCHDVKACSSSTAASS